MSDSIRFENYELLRNPDGSPLELGRGAMGVTYKARDTDLHCDVALKVISPHILDSLEVRERFFREARAAAQLRHPNIATVFRLGATPDGTHYYAMEYCEGQTLQQMLAARGPLAASTAMHLAWQVSKALRLAEQHRLIHRDLKPANLIVTEPPDEGLVIKVIDFGLAKSFGDGHQSMASNAAGFAGTAHYASPEQIDELDLDIRSDIYSLGACLWFMLTGHPPFEGSVARVMSQTLSAEPPWQKLAGQPGDLVALLRRMLAKNRDDRHPTAAALRVELERCLESLSAGAGDEEPPTVAAPPSSGSETGRLTARFALGERVGRDALGRIFHASDRERGGASVIYRVVDPALTAVPATRRELEAQVAAASAHPHPGLVNVLAAGATGQGLIVVTERVAGFTLLEVLKHRGALPPHEALSLLTPLAAAADHAAAHGLRGFSLTTGQTWVHFDGAAAENPADSVARPAGEWAAHRLKVEVLSLGGETGEDDAGLQSMATRASHGQAPTRSAPDALARLACQLLGGSGGDFTPLPRLSEQANAVLRRASSDPAAFPTAAAFLDTLRPALGKASASIPGTHRSHAPLAPITPDWPATIPNRAPSPARAFLIPASLVLLAVVIGVAYYIGIRAPREQARQERSAAGETVMPAEKDPVQKSPESQPAAGNARSKADETVDVPASPRLAASTGPAPPPATPAPPPATPAPPPATPAPPPSGRILVNTIPPRATVLLDDRMIGRTPTRIDDVQEGVRRLAVQLTGYEPAELIVEVTRGATSDPGTIHLIALKPTPAPAPPAPPAPAPVTLPTFPPMEKRASSGLADESVRSLIVNQLNATVRGDFGGSLACYASPVDYYDEGRLNSAQLRRSIESYHRMWPNYQIGDLSEITINETSDPDTKLASYHFVFVARNPQNGKQSRGVAHDDITVRNIGGRAQITRCRQSVTDRQKNF